MILITHIAVALSSLISSGIVFFYPSALKLRIAYILVALTLVSGFYLVLSKPAHMTQTCIEGLAYLAVVSYAIVSARHRLANTIIVK